MEPITRSPGRKRTPDSVILFVQALLPATNLSYRAIGERVGCSTSTVKKIKDGLLVPLGENIENDPNTERNL
jgi:hypothetical protein